MYRYKQPRNINIMNPEDYVSYTLALALKEAGFDEPCYAQWACEPDGKPIIFGSTAFVFRNSECKGRDVAAHFIWQAQKRLREKKKIDVLVWNCACGYGWEVSKAENGTGLILFDDKGDNKDSGCWTSYESALSAGIAAALDFLDNEKE